MRRRRILGPPAAPAVALAAPGGDRRPAVAHWLALVAALAAALTAGGPAARAASATPAAADTLRLSLSAAVERALAEGEEMQDARAVRATARALYVQARSSALPQLNLSTSYTRQIESVFQGAVPEIEPFEADTVGAELIDRVRDLEDAMPTAGLAGLGALFSSTSFASENTWVANLALSQKLFEGGSIWNSISAAKHALYAAETAEADREREAVLGVREAYLGALLADRGVRIAELALEQTETQLQRVRLRADAGEASEFERLQAEVARENQVPAVMRAQTLRALAYLEVARLVNLPAGVPLELTTPILEDAAIPADPAAVDTVGLVGEALRSPGLVALEEVLQARAHAVPVAASGRWPALSLFASFSQQAYPGEVFPKAGDWFRDARAGAQINWSLFDGLRTSGAVQQAKAERARAGQALGQARERVRQAMMQNEGELERAAADLHARSRTVQLARRAYELASLRYEEGASDLLEVGDARIALQVAQTYEAQARHDYFLALARLERFSGRPVFSSAAAAVGE